MPSKGESPPRRRRLNKDEISPAARNIGALIVVGLYAGVFRMGYQRRQTWMVPVSTSAVGAAADYYYGKGK